MADERTALVILDPTAPIIRISGDGDRELLAIHPDGSVEGRIEDASEAARVFVRELRGLTSQVKAEPLDTEAVAEVLYNADMKMRYGHVKQAWAERQHGAQKQTLRKQAELILFDYDVTPKGKN